MADFNNGLAVNGPLTISDEVTASVHFGSVVKAIIDDCSRHTDGGAWRKQCQGKSWFTETLGGEVWIGQQASIAAAWSAANSLPGAVFQATATAGPLTSGKFYVATSATTATEVFRGISRDYPDAVLWVAEAGRVVGYDMTKPGYPMWMVFVASSGGTLYNGSCTCLAAFNGQLVVGSVLHLAQADFSSDYTRFRNANGNLYNVNRIVNRNSATGPIQSGTIPAIVSQIVNDVAITVLDTAPIDPATGLPVPTIAVATAGGVSVIKDDGSVVNGLGTTGVSSVAATPDRLFYWKSSDDWGFTAIPFAGIAASFNGTNYQSGSQLINYGYPIAGKGFVGLRGTKGIQVAKENPATPAKLLLAEITSTYCSGWKIGDMRGAYLADTTAETITDGTSELVTNGTFTTDTSGWTADYANLSAVSGALRITTTSASNDATAFQYISGLIVGRMYAVSLTFSAGTTGSGSIALSTGAMYSSDYGFYDLSISVPVMTFKAIGTTLGISLLNQSSNVGTYSIFDNVSCKMLSELVANGTFTTDTSGWTAGGGATLSTVSGAMRVTSDATGTQAGYAYQTFTTVVGKSYSVTLQIAAGTASDQRFRVGYTGANTNQYGEQAGPGAKTFNFVALTTTTTISVGQNVLTASVYSDFDNISVKLADPDRSVKNTGLVLNGTLTKTAVATGAGLVAYSGFSASNYLEQPYNANMDFGTGDFCIMGWAQGSATLSTCNLVSKCTNSTTGFQFLKDTTSNNGRLYIRTNGTAYTASSGGLNDASMHFCLVRRVSGMLDMWQDGIQVMTPIANTDNISISASTQIGWSTYSPMVHPIQGMALWRISATAPTADQIAHIYRTELPLFQPNAQCTIAGTSTAVTALAYDESTDILHAGTSWGRSEFKNLLRVQSEATSVGAITSLSAVNGTIAQCGTSTKVSTKQLSIRDSLLNKEQEQKAKATTKVIDYTAIASQTAFVLQKGWTIKRLYKNGTRVRESTTGSYFIRSNDGFQETATLSTACTAGDWISIHQERKLNV